MGKIRALRIAETVRSPHRQGDTIGSNWYDETRIKGNSTDVKILMREQN